MEICNYLLRKKYSFILVFFFKEHAFESSQKYKEGKYIIELVHMIKDNGWDDENADQSEYLKK
jgi:hypothetical protein